MKVNNYLQFAMHEYNNGTSTLQSLGDVVYKKPDPFYGSEGEVGVIIQVHTEHEYRTDQFGNCCSSELELATLEQITEYRPDILEHLIKNHESIQEN